MDVTIPMKFTGAQMCELIAAHWKAIGLTPEWWDGTPEGIWNYSPSGELWAVVEWFAQARLFADTITRALAL